MTQALKDLLLDDFSRGDGISALDTRWQAVSDRVMGGISRAKLTFSDADGGSMRLTGDVRLENNGGFVQAAIDLAPNGGPVDLSGYAGVRLAASGPKGEYVLSLRTTDLTRPWQSYRWPIPVSSERREMQLAFQDIAPHRTDIPFNAKTVRRLGLLAVGRAFTADITVRHISFVTSISGSL